MHRLTLHFFKATRSLKRAPTPLRFLIQVRITGLVFGWAMAVVRGLVSVEDGGGVGRNRTRQQLPLT